MFELSLYNIQTVEQYTIIRGDERQKCVWAELFLVLRFVPVKNKIHIDLVVTTILIKQ